MARNLTIPIEFIAASRRRRYMRGRARVLAWTHWSSVLFVWVAIRDPAGQEHKHRITHRCLPTGIISRLRGIARSESKASELVEFEVILCLPAPETERQWMILDPWQCRQDFLKLPRDSGRLMKFLRQTGTWFDDMEVWPDWEIGSRIPEREFGVIYPELVWNQQNEIRAVLAGKPAEWLNRASDLTKFDLSTRAQYPYFVHHAEYGLDAIRSSITFDFLRGVKFGICKREDCGNPFEMAHKGKIYCTQYCGHLVSLRKKRASQDSGKRGKH